MLSENLNNLIDNLDGGAALALRLADNLGVTALIGLDWGLAFGRERAQGGEEEAGEAEG